jgi:hypothetical protein
MPMAPTAGANHVNFKLGTAGDNVLIKAANGTTTIDSVTFGAQARAVSQGRLPDGGGVIASFALSPSPSRSNWVPATVVINEALTNSSPPLVDAIELHNPGASAVDLSGWWLSDDPAELRKVQLPAGTSIAAGGYLVLEESLFNTGASAFSLSATGDEIVLSAVDGAGILTGLPLASELRRGRDGVSFGRIATAGVPEFWPLTARTFGAPNAAPKTAPVIINEVMYHPVDFAGTPPTDNARDEFIELHNHTTSVQNIAGWRLKNDADFTFPAGSAIRPGDYVVVVTFNPSTNTALADALPCRLCVTALSGDVRTLLAEASE